ncbi:MAG: PIG-L family deacetylase [Chloroflexi bacterium]|nr:PIG-L family deacetylase [Chloroflexota bacterium]MDA1226889.1 PIG-L family deacetylase [Chloroflexota bacterium]
MPDKSRSLLCIFAHPDDESFGPGGTLAKYAASGTRITVISATRGEGSTLGRETHQANLGDVREAEMRCASEALGLAESRVLHYPYTGLNDVDDGELCNLVTNAIAELKPDVVMAFGPGGITGNPDHVAITRAATSAIQRMPQQLRPSLFYWAIPEAIASRLRELSDIPFVGVPKQDINTVIDTSDFLETQLNAIRCHKSQSDPMPPVLTERLKMHAGDEYFVRVGPGADSENISNDIFS